MAYFPFQSGQQPMSSSQGVVIASNQSPVSVAGTVGSSIIGLVPVNISNFPTTQNVSGSVVATQGTTPWIITGSVQGSLGSSIIGQLPAGTAVLGSVAVLQGTTPWLISSVYGNVSGSVVAFQGTSPWAVTGSIAGTAYVERNDAVASFLGADLTYRPQAGDSAGRTVIKPFAPDESRLDTATSVVSTSVTALFSSVTGLRNYVTDIMVANTGATATLVTFKDGSTSVLGYTIAPAAGGSNIIGMNFPLRTAPGQDFVFQAATASSVLYVTAKGYKAP